MISVEEFSQLLTVLYSAPLNPEQWPKFLDLLCQHTGSRTSFLMCADSRQTLSIRAQGGFAPDPTVLSTYAAEYSGSDPFRLPSISLGSTGVLDCEKLLTRNALEASDFYRYLIEPSGYQYPGLVALTCTLRRLEVISFWRSGEEGYLDADSVRLLELLVPHLQVAMEIRYALGITEIHAKGAETMADASTTPAFLLSGGGSVLHINAAASELVSDGDGLILKDGLLGAAKSSMRKPLQQLIRETHMSLGWFAGSPGAKPLSLERLSSRRPLQLLASPIARKEEGAILLLATDPEKPIVLTDDVLREHYGMTQAQTEVANGLLTGYSLEEIAALRKVKIGTVRNQLKTMMAKTGTGKQSDLVRLLLSLPRLN